MAVRRGDYRNYYFVQYYVCMTTCKYSYIHHINQSLTRDEINEMNLKSQSQMDQYTWMRIIHFTVLTACREVFVAKMI